MTGYADTVVENMRVGAILTDPDGVILLSNKAARSLLGRPLAAGSRIHEALDDLSLDPPLERILGSSGGGISARAVRLHPDLLHLDLEIARLEPAEADAGSTGPRWLWTVSGAARRGIEEHFSRNFLSLISHKLRTPLTPLLGYCDVLGKEFEKKGLGGIFTKALGTIHSEAERLHRLVEQLLEFVSLSQAETRRTGEERVDLSTAARDSVKNLDAAIRGKATRIDVEVAGPAVVHSDPLSIYKILAELIDNAVKFNPKPDKTVVVGVHTVDGVAVLSVADNGSGIPREEWGNIFDRFYQIESTFTGQVEGWGLGLALVKSLVENWRGSIDLESEAGRGTKMMVRMSLAASPEPRASGARASPGNC